LSIHRKFAEIQGTKTLVKDTRWELKTKLVDTEACMGYGSGTNIVPVMDRVKLLKSAGS
jgi:hypothetical protein